MTKRLPPYGREVIEILQSPERLRSCSGCTEKQASIWIATGFDAWDWRHERPQHLAVVLPAGEDPADLDWSFIHGHEPALLIGSDSTDTQNRQAIACAMFRDGVTAVLAPDGVLMKTPQHQSLRMP
jgi:hypothetical protein